MHAKYKRDKYGLTSSSFSSHIVVHVVVFVLGRKIVQTQNFVDWFMMLMSIIIVVYLLEKQFNDYIRGEIYQINFYFIWWFKGGGVSGKGGLHGLSRFSMWYTFICCHFLNVQC